MRDFVHAPVYIVSAHLTQFSDIQNATATRVLAGDLEEQGIDAKPVTGSYKGVEEQSFVISATRQQVLDIAFNYGQESVLFLNHNREAFLLFRASRIVGTNEVLPIREDHIGSFIACSEAEALEGDAWTKDNGSNQFYRVCNSDNV